MEDRVKKLEKENKELRDALKKVVDYIEYMDNALCGMYLKSHPNGSWRKFSKPWL